jgi:hypothetical protein
MWYAPGPSFGYTLKQIDDHPWSTLLTMKEVLRLDPGSIEFVGPDATSHVDYWSKETPQHFTAGKMPIFILDTTPIHPHTVEIAPRQPFRPWKD